MSEALIHSVLARFRRRRMRRVQQWFALGSHSRVLDVGGTPWNWQFLPLQPQLTILNMPRAGEEVGRAGRWVAGDGCALPFPDRSFDLVFSNSVIEHVGSPERQRQFASEIARVGRSYMVETPDRAFPVEPHLLTPFVHYLPPRARRAVVNRFTVWEWIARPSPDRLRYYKDHILEDVRLLGAADMRALFPDAHIHREHFFGLSKSLLALRFDSRPTVK